MSDFAYNINGRHVKLAEIATPKRISAFCSIFGKNKLSDLILPAKDAIDESTRSLNVVLLDAMGDASLTQKILNTCTDSEFTLEEAAEVDSELTGKIALDFFLSLIVRYFRRPRLRNS